MRNIFKDFDDRKDKDVDEKAADKEKLNLRAEELDINKKRVKAGDVELGKEIIEEDKVVDVPITHEEVVIERHSLDNERCDSSIDPENSIHIPISKDVVDVGKHTVLTGEVSARKKEVEETQRVSETLKREEARVNKEGEATVTSDADRR